jgi:E3 ubiquitin-protein ligase ZNF598
VDRKFYNRTDLARHNRIGDEDEKSYKGHPLCKFCDQRYFDKDELLKHLRKDHFYCHLCEEDGISTEYFRYVTSPLDSVFHCGIVVVAVNNQISKGNSF